MNCPVNKNELKTAHELIHGLFTLLAKDENKDRARDLSRVIYVAAHYGVNCPYE